MLARTDLEQSLHRLANRIECELADLFQQLLADSRIGAVSSLPWSGARFVESLREVRDNKEGGEE
jgi:hypothetical protein